MVRVCVCMYLNYSICAKAILFVVLMRNDYVKNDAVAAVLIGIAQASTLSILNTLDLALAVHAAE